MRRLFTTSWLIVLLTGLSMPSLAETDDDWVNTRSLSEGILLAVAEPTSNATKNARIRALLTLSDRAIHSSKVEATKHLEQAESLLHADSDAAVVANAIRCQLDHRQSLPAAETSCRQLNETDLSSKSRFVQAFVRGTQMYLNYYEGQHTESVEAAKRTLELATFVDDASLLAAANNMIGLHFATRMRPRIALPHYENALEHAGRLPFPGPRTLTQLNLASSYTYLGRAEEALQILLEASTSPVVRIYPARELVLESMIAHARVSVGDTGGAEETLKSVIDRLGSSVTPDQMTFGYTALGAVQFVEQRPNDALDNFDKALSLIGKNFESDLDHSRIQFMAAPYAAALRESGRIAESRRLLKNVIAIVPVDEPDQLLVDAYKELNVTLAAAGDSTGARIAEEKALALEASLWDASFEYQIARLNASFESDRRINDLERARERETALQDIANRETMLRRQTWLIGAMIIAVIALLFSRRLQKRIAATERAATVRLDAQVKERTQELEDEMAKRMAGEVERRKLAERMFEGEKLRSMGQLTAGVAHDFNNLMTVVTLGADQLKADLHGDHNPDTAETLEHIRSAADTGAKITRGLLAYVRAQPLQPENLQLDEILRDALPMFRNTLGERFTLSVNLVTCRVLVDKGQLTSAILNLLLNAKEAMPDGGRIVVTLKNVGGQAEIEVRDSGTGMSPEILKHAIDPFFTTKDNEEGTGLGLSMVFGFAKQSNGNLNIDSVEHKGTTVTLNLPLAPDHPARLAGGAARFQQLPKDLQILAVEDRAQLLNVLERSLSQLGVHVACATSADEALDMVTNTGLPDVVITDIVMPGKLDGLGLVAELRKMKPDLPIVLMSGYTRDVDDECTFLHKPFSFDELENAIKTTLYESQMRRA